MSILKSQLAATCTICGRVKIESYYRYSRRDYVGDSVIYTIGGYIGIQSHTSTMCERVKIESYFRYSRREYIGDSVMYIIGGYIAIQSHTSTMCGRVQTECPVYLRLESPMHRELYYRYNRRIYRRL